MPRKLKARFFVDDQFWSTEHRGRGSIHLSSFHGPVPVAAIRYEGTKSAVADRARVAASAISAIHEVRVSNRRITLYVTNNGLMRESEAEELRTLFLSRLETLAAGGTIDTSNEHRDGRQPAAKVHRGLDGSQRRFGGYAN